MSFRTDTARVLGKGRKERLLPFGHKTALALDRYLRARSRHNDASLNWLWLGQQGRLTSRGVQLVVRRRGAQAGLPGLHPHQLRHTFCHQWCAPGWRRGRPDAPRRLDLAREATASSPG